MPHRPFEYPPLFAVFPMMLLSYLAYNTALAFFYAMNAILLAASFWMLRKLLWPPFGNDGAEHHSPWRSPLAGLLMTLVLAWRFIHSNTNESNANLYMLFLLTLALHGDRHWTFNGSETARGGVLSGVAVALATAIKLTPGLFGLYFLWSRRAWAMLGGAIGLLLFLVVIPGALLGWQTNLNYLDAYKTFALGKTMGTETGEATSPNRIIIGRPRQLDPNESASAQGVGVSIRGILTSLLTPSPALKASGDRPRTVNVTTLDPRHVSAIANVLTLMVLLSTVALTVSPRTRQSIGAAALSWSLVVVAMTLISPLTRIAHLVVLVIPIATLVSMLQHKRLSRASTSLTLAAFVLLMVSTMTGEYLHAIGFTTFSLLVLYSALASALITRTHPNRAPDTAAVP